MKSLVVAVCVCAAVAVSAGCKGEDDKPQAGAGGSAAPAPAPAAPSTAAGEEAEHEHDEHDRLPIGEATAGGLKFVATMDEPVKPGGEGAFDVAITGGKPKAVRFWVGVESAEGSVKAKAEEEKTGNWHAHAEVPDPLPAGSKFWVEVEPPTGETIKVSFDPKVE
jgi:hypothetical protein